MTLDASKPANDAYATTVNTISRETRNAVNDNETAIAAIGSSAITNDITLTAGQTTLTIGSITGTDLLDINNEIAIVSTSETPDIATISNGQDGMIKHFRSNGSTFNFVNTGNIVLLQPSGITTFNVGDGDIISFYNDGGVQGSSNGTWYEFNRSLKS